MSAFLLTHTGLPSDLTPLHASWPHAQMQLEPPADAACWQQFSRLSEPRLLVYPGSLGDPLAPGFTVADLAADWRLGLILTLPLDRPDCLSLAAAYSALARQARARLVGFVGVGVGVDPTETALVPYLGPLTAFSWSALPLLQTRG